MQANSAWYAAGVASVVFVAGVLLALQSTRLRRQLRDADRATSLWEGMTSATGKQEWEAELLGSLDDIRSVIDGGKEPGRRSSRFLLAVFLVLLASFALVVWLNGLLATRHVARPPQIQLPSPEPYAPYMLIYGLSAMTAVVAVVLVNRWVSRGGLGRSIERFNEALATLRARLKD